MFVKTLTKSYETYELITGKLEEKWSKIWKYKEFNGKFLKELIDVSGKY